MAEDKLTTTLSPTNATGGGEQPGGDGRTFTQAEMDAIIADRLRRQKAQFGDYEALKDKATKFDEVQQAQMSELEKVQAERDQAQAERDSALQKANSRLIESAVLAASAKAGMAHPEHAFMLVDLADVSVADDGAVQGVDKAVATLLKAYPEYVGRRAAPATDAGAGGGDRITGARLPRLTQEQMNYANKMGVSHEAYAKQVGAIAVQRAGGEPGDNQLETLRAENRQIRAQLQRMTDNGG